MSLSIGGLGSGLDTQSIISQLMRAEAGPQSKLRASKSALTVKAGAWTTLSNLTKGLNEKAQALATPDKLRLTSSTSSTPTVATATSTPTATPGSLTFQVNQLATRHQVATAGLASATDPVGEGSVAVSSGTTGIGASVSIADADGVTGTYAVVVTTAADGTHSANVNGTATAFGTDADGKTTLSVGGAVLTFAAGPTAGTASVAVVKTSATSSLNDLSTELGKLGGPATAAVVNDGSATPYRLVLSAAATGKAGAFTMTSSTSVTAKAAATPLVEAQNATLTIGDPTTGITVERSSNSVSDLMPGVTLNLVKASTEPVTVTVNRDDDAVVAQVKGLHDSLNGLISWIATNSKYDVAAKRGGPMVGDASVRALAFQVSSAIQTSQADGAYRSAGSIGLSPNRTGTFDLDETKLRAALKADPDAVANVVSGLAEAVGKVTKAANDAEGLVKTGQQSTESRSRDLQGRIDAWDTRLLAIQKRYSKQFSALDSAMARMNSQSSWLSGQINSMNASSS